MSKRVDLVGLPINAMLDWPMGTQSGFTLFLDPKVNARFKKVLSARSEFLFSPASASILATDASCWFGETDVKDLTITANVGESSLSFEDMFVCDPIAKHHGFTSWDHFFTHTLKEGIRPIASPDDPTFIADACGSYPYKTAHGVMLRDSFWIKDQPYSLLDLLAHSSLASRFVGGTIYQAFLSALSYHPWHSPVAGKIVKGFVVNGTYFSEPMLEKFTEEHAADESGEGTGQGYIRYGDAGHHIH